MSRQPQGWCCRLHGLERILAIEAKRQIMARRAVTRPICRLWLVMTRSKHDSWPEKSATRPNGESFANCASHDQRSALAILWTAEPGIRKIGRTAMLKQGSWSVQPATMPNGELLLTAPAIIGRLKASLMWLGPIDTNGGF